jgi:hypothetical protein
MKLSVKVAVPVKHHMSRDNSCYHKRCTVKDSETGLVLTGSKACDETHIPTADIAAQYEAAVNRKLKVLPITDSRASQLLVLPDKAAECWWVVPAKEPFTRHSGSCLILGDRRCNSGMQPIQVGDFLRLGSVGLLVIESHDGVNHSVLTESEAWALASDREGSLPAELFNGEALTAQDEDESIRRRRGRLKLRYLYEMTLLTMLPVLYASHLLARYSKQPVSLLVPEQW